MTILRAGTLPAGLAALQRGQLREARADFEAVVQQEPANAVAWYWLATTYVRSQQWVEAKKAIEQAIAFTPNEASYWLIASNIEQDLGNIEGAIERVRGAIRLQPHFPEAYNNLGILLVDSQAIADARDAFATAVEQKPNYARALTNLSSAYLRLGDPRQAAHFAAQAREADPQNPMALQAVGQTAVSVGDLVGAKAAFRETVARQPSNADAVLALVKILISERAFDEARQVVANGLTHSPKHVALWSAQGEIATQQDDMEGALQSFQRGLQLSPDHLGMTMRAVTALPSVYSSVEHLVACRERFVNGVEYLWSNVEKLSANIKPETLATQIPTTFFLGYQGQDDAAIQRRYGEFVTAILTKALPEYFRPMVPPDAEGRRVRVGFCSRFFYTSTAGNYFASWITDLDRTLFETFVYFPKITSDPLTERLRASAEHFSQRDVTLQKLADEIRGDQLDILIYPELGMDATIYLLAALRLAPIQLAAWGHPVTPGLPNIDGYFSCADMEPNDASEHYNEPLFLLPSIGTRYAQPTNSASALEKNRADYSLPDGKTLYLMPQSLFKIHPECDALMVEVLAQDPNGVLVLFTGHSSNVTNRFITRLSGAFERRGLAAPGRVKILPSLPHDDYKRVNMLCDVMLDTPHWSGGNTSLDALAFGLPVVTLPGPLMRGRQSMAMLNGMGLSELVAHEPAKYCEIALRLGTDKAYRASISARILDNRHRLFDDAAPTVALAAHLIALARPHAAATTLVS